eukprot:scaffold332_cov308-Pavlova_lutheri.AAC.5
MAFVRAVVLFRLPSNLRGSPGFPVEKQVCGCGVGILHRPWRRGPPEPWPGSELAPSSPSIGPSSCLHQSASGSSPLAPDRDPPGGYGLRSTVEPDPRPFRTRTWFPSPKEPVRVRSLGENEGWNEPLDRSCTSASIGVGSVRARTKALARATHVRTFRWARARIERREAGNGHDTGEAVP